VKFTTDTRDSVTGLDYADQRCYASTFGRFMTPDLGSGGAGNPGSLNRYSYTRGDPVNRHDPTGLDDVTFSVTRAITMPLLITTNCLN
jgi:RHS repeat-associated protein